MEVARGGSRDAPVTDLFGSHLERKGSMKKLLTLVVAVGFVAFALGCGGETKSTTKTTTPTGSTTTTTEKPK